MDFAPVHRPSLGVEFRDCRALWCAVLERAWHDAFPVIDGRGKWLPRNGLSHVRGWFGTESFFIICDRAGFDGHYILRLFGERLAQEADTGAAPKAGGK